MKPLSPVDAIGPAFSRMRILLAPPAQPGLQPTFRFGFFLKLALVAALTNAGFYGASLGFAMQAVSFTFMSLGGGRIRHSDLATPSGPAAALLAGFAVAAMVALGLSILFGWLGCRLRFTLFDLVLYGRGRVALAWSAYGPQAWRYFGLMVLVSLALLLLIASTAGPLLLHMVATLRHMTPQQINHNPAVILVNVLPMYGIFFLFGLIATVADALTQDFLLPPMAIEDAPLESAFARFFRLLRARFWSVAAYLFLRFVIELGLTWAGLMALFLVLFLLGLGGAGIGFLLYRSLWYLGGLAALVFILYCVVAGLILLGLYLVAMICVYGLAALFKQCYAVYFYGSYYQELGSRLEPPEINPAPLPAAPPPTGMPPALESPPPIW